MPGRLFLVTSFGEAKEVTRPPGRDPASAARPCQVHNANRKPHKQSVGRRKAQRKLRNPSNAAPRRDARPGAKPAGAPASEGLTTMLRLPGLAFESAPAMLDERLPRMDIALFVGFARRGPIDRPVVCEDYAAFTSVFGAEHELFTDATSGAPVTAQLAPAVQSFFANGGQRCWVLRVALQPVTAKLPLAGLWYETGLGWRAAQARASSGGRWGFGVRTGVRLERSPIGVLDTGNPWDGAAPHRIALDPASSALPEAGDLLRFVSETPDTSLNSAFSRVVVFLRVASVLKRN